MLANVWALFSENIIYQQHFTISIEDIQLNQPKHCHACSVFVKINTADNGETGAKYVACLC